MSQTHNDLHLHMVKLKKLAGKCGAQVDGEDASKQAEPEVDTSNMTRYEKGRYEVTRLMSDIRTDLADIQEIEKSGGDSKTQTRKVQLANKVRKDIRAMKKETHTLKTDANKEQKLDEYDELVQHMKKTEKMWLQRNKRDRPGFDDDDDLCGNGGGGGVSGREMKDLSSLMDGSAPQGDLTESLLDPAEDQEFQMFYANIKQKDQEIDQGLDIIAGQVQRVHQQAKGIAEELAVQAKQLDVIEDKVDKRTAEIQGLNNKLKDITKELEKDKYCCYLICLLLVLGILGVVASQTGLFK
eukprot:Rhum_TRINITY_DN14425_c0_g1::Rhum_TRINITY_DN14425_c0_g1_i1::g.90034::m.90034